MPSLRPDKWVEKLGELTGLSANDIAGALPSAEQLAGVNKALASFKLGDLAEQGVNRLVGHPTRAGDYMQTLGNLIHAGNLPLRLMQTQFAAPEYGQRLAGWALADPTRERPK